MKRITFDHIQKRKKELEVLKRTLDGYAHEALRASKRAIFAFQRGDGKEAGELLGVARDNVRLGTKIVFKQPLLTGDGQWRAALEEYTEATLFGTYLDGEMRAPDECAEYPDVLLGGLSDTAGELARYAVLRATERDKKAVESAYKTALHIVELFAALDLTGSLRAKFDQSKSHLRKIEDIRYDLSK